MIATLGKDTIEIIIFYLRNYHLNVILYIIISLIIITFILSQKIISKVDHENHTIRMRYLPCVST